MTRSYTLNCKRGSGTRFHKPTGTCKKPCKVSHGPAYRRSPKDHACKLKGAKKSSSSKSKAKMSSAAKKIVAAMRKYSSKKAAMRKSSSSKSKAQMSSAAKKIAAAVRRYSSKKAKMTSAAKKITAAVRKYSSKKKTKSASTRPHVETLKSGLNLKLNTIFTTPHGTYKRVSKTISSKGYIKM